MKTKDEKEFTDEKGFKGKGKGKGRKPSKFRGADRYTKHENDPAFYFKYSALAQNAGTIPFARRNGDWVHYNYGGLAEQVNLDSFLIYDTIMNPGISDDIMSGINVTSTAAWKMLHRKYRGVNAYEQSDFGIIQFGIVDFFRSLAEAERYYGICRYYSLNQTQLPNALLIALGVDPESFKDLADYRLHLNRLILSAKTLCLVRGYSLLDHSQFMFSNVFKDRDTDRAQIYAFRSPGYWLYDPTNPNGSSLRFIRYSTDTVMRSNGNNVCHLRTASTVLSDLEYQLTALLTDTDVDRVCSDTLAFFGNKEEPAELVRLSEIPEDYTVAPIYSDTMNRQHHNLTIFGSTSELPNAVNGTNTSTLREWGSIVPASFAPELTIWQEDNVIKFNITNYGAASTSSIITITRDGKSYHVKASDALSELPDYWFEQPIIDTDILSPSAEEVFEMTRLTQLDTKLSLVDTEGSQYAVMSVKTCPSMLVIHGQVFLNGAQAQYSYTAGQGQGFNHILSYVNLTTFSPIWQLGMSSSDYAPLSRFDWIPICMDQGDAILADLDNYRGYDYQTAAPINDIALLSEFKNPVVDMLLAPNSSK